MNTSVTGLRVLVYPPYSPLMWDAMRDSMSSVWPV